MMKMITVPLVQAAAIAALPVMKKMKKKMMIIALLAHVVGEILRAVHPAARAVDGLVIPKVTLRRGAKAMVADRHATRKMTRMIIVHREVDRAAPPVAKAVDGSVIPKVTLRQDAKAAVAAPHVMRKMRMIIVHHALVEDVAALNRANAMMRAAS